MNLLHLNAKKMSSFWLYHHLVMVSQRVRILPEYKMDQSHSLLHREQEGNKNSLHLQNKVIKNKVAGSCISLTIKIMPDRLDLHHRRAPERSPLVKATTTTSFVAGLVLN